MASRLNREFDAHLVFIVGVKLGKAYHVSSRLCLHPSLVSARFREDNVKLLCKYLFAPKPSTKSRTISHLFVVMMMFVAWCNLVLSSRADCGPGHMSAGMAGSIFKSSQDVWSLMELPEHQARPPLIYSFVRFFPEKKCEGPSCGSDRQERPLRLSLPSVVTAQKRIIGLQGMSIEHPLPAKGHLVDIDRIGIEVRSVEVPFRPPISS